MKIQIIAIVQKEIEIPNYMDIKGNIGDLNYRIENEKNSFQDEVIGKNLFSIKTRVLK